MCGDPIFSKGKIVSWQLTILRLANALETDVFDDKKMCHQRCHNLPDVTVCDDLAKPTINPAASSCGFRVL